MQTPLTPQNPLAENATVRTASGLIIVSFVLALLYLGRVVFEPLAIAILLAFILSPPIRRLRRWEVGRATSVIAVVAVTLAVIGAVVFVTQSEVTRLAGEIPQYQSNLRAKISSLNSALVPSGALQRASTTLNNLAGELKNKGSSSAGDGPLKDEPVAPIPVEVHVPQPAILDYLQNFLGPLMAPLTMGGLLILFLIFILFYREDLRDRVLRLAGTADLQRTTEAMNDAGQRLSRFFLIQSAINASFGTVIGLVLWMIGIPNPILWGMLAAVLRFVPYVGTPIAAVFPLVLASAIDPGWTKVFATAALFFGSEVITGQAIEPVLQGQQTGLSPVAIVISQLFWTLLWGVPGLLLAVPITVCIAVLSKHTGALSFIGVILGDEPALAPHEGFYQRVLAGDATEAAFQAEGQLATEPLTDYYDAVPMKALALAYADAAEGRLSQDKQEELYETIEEVVEDLADYDDVAKPVKKTEAAKPEDKEDKEEGGGLPAAGGDGGGAPKIPYPILLIPARNAVDQSASLLLSDILSKRGLEPSLQSNAHGGRKKLSAETQHPAKIVCISCFGERLLPVRYLIRRWRRFMPGARFVACFWLSNGDGAKLEEWQKNTGADFVAGSLREAAQICGELAARSVAGFACPEPAASETVAAGEKRPIAA